MSGWRARAGRFVKRLSVAVVTLALLGAAGLAALVGWYLTRRDAAPPPPAASEVTLPRGLRSATLYFASAGGDSLVAVERQVVESERVTESVRLLVDELVRGPAGGPGRAVFPAGVTVRHVFFAESGSVYVDFSEELTRRFRGGSTAEYLLLASLVRTLSVNLPTVQSVVITVGGRPVSTLGGHFDLEAPLAASQWR